MVGQSEELYQREGTIEEGNARLSHMNAYIIIYRPYIKVGLTRRGEIRKIVATHQ